MTDFEIASASLPLANVVDTSLQVTNPELWALIDYLVFWVNKELNPSFSGLGLPFTSLLDLSNCYYLPLTLAGVQSLTRLPAMFCQLTEMEPMDWTRHKTRINEKFLLQYVFQSLDVAALTKAYPFFAVTCSTMIAALVKNTKDNTSRILRSCDLTIGKAKFGALEYEGAPNAKLYPMFSLELTISKLIVAGPGQIDAQACTGADATIESQAYGGSKAQDIEIVSPKPGA